MVRSSVAVRGQMAVGKRFCTSVEAKMMMAVVKPSASAYGLDLPRLVMMPTAFATNWPCGVSTLKPQNVSSCSIAMMNATAVMKPESTAWLSRHATKPSFATPRRQSTSPAKRASMIATTGCSSSGTFISLICTAISTQTTDTGPTARCGDEPKMA